MSNKIDLRYNIKSAFKYVEREARYSALKDKNVALVRIEYHYEWKEQNNKLCLGYRYAWLNRQQLTDLYEPRTGLVKKMRDGYYIRQVSMHETFRRDVSVLLILDIDKIPHDMVEWFRGEVEKRLVAFWNETFSNKPMHKITVNNVLWQDSSRYGNGDPYEKGGSLVLIVTDVKRCFQFCSIEAAYTFASRFVNLLLASDDEKLPSWQRSAST